MLQNLGFRNLQLPILASYTKTLSLSISGGRFRGLVAKQEATRTTQW